MHWASHFKSKYIKFKYTQNRNRKNRIWSVTTQIRDCQQNQSVQLLLLMATEEELISLIYLQIDQLTPCYCAPELYNKSSILSNIDNWNTKTTDINTIIFSITIQVKIHQTLAQLHSASHFKSKYIVFRETQNKKEN